MGGEVGGDVDVWKSEASGFGGQEFAEGRWVLLARAAEGLVDYAVVGGVPSVV